MKKNCKKYVEEYQGYTIRRMGNALNIYDKNGCYIKRVDSLIIRVAKIEIDKIIKRNGNYKKNEMDFKTIL